MAIEYLTRARAVDRNDLEVLNNLGAAYLRTEKFTAATDVFESIVSLRPDLFEPLYNLGVCYQQNNRHADALNAYNRALEIRPDDPFAWNNKGRAHESLGQLREAAQAYSRASDLRPTEIVFARNATVMLSKAGMAGDAARYMERVNQLGGDSSIQMVSVEGHGARRAVPRGGCASGEPGRDASRQCGLLVQPRGCGERAGPRG